MKSNHRMEDFISNMPDIKSQYLNNVIRESLCVQCSIFHYENNVYVFDTNVKQVHFMSYYFSVIFICLHGFLSLSRTNIVQVLLSVMSWLKVPSST